MEVITMYFKILSQYLQEDTGEHHKYLNHDTWSTGQDLCNIKAGQHEC